MDEFVLEKSLVAVNNKKDGPIVPYIAETLVIPVAKPIFPGFSGILQIDDTGLKTHLLRQYRQRKKILQNGGSIDNSTKNLEWIGLFLYNPTKQTKLMNQEMKNAKTDEEMSKERDQMVRQVIQQMKREKKNSKNKQTSETQTVNTKEQNTNANETSKVSTTTNTNGTTTTNSNVNTSAASSQATTPNENNVDNNNKANENASSQVNVNVNVTQSQVQQETKDTREQNVAQTVEQHDIAPNVQTVQAQQQQILNATDAHTDSVTVDGVTVDETTSGDATNATVDATPIQVRPAHTSRHSEIPWNNSLDEPNVDLLLRVPHNATGYDEVFEYGTLVKIDFSAPATNIASFDEFEQREFGHKHDKKKSVTTDSNTDYNNTSIKDVNNTCIDSNIVYNVMNLME